MLIKGLVFIYVFMKATFPAAGAGPAGRFPHTLRSGIKGARNMGERILPI